MAARESETLNGTEAANRLGTTRYGLMSMALLGKVGYTATVDGQIRFDRGDVEALVGQSRKVSKMETSIA